MSNQPPKILNWAEVAEAGAKRAMERYKSRQEVKEDSLPSLSGRSDELREKRKHDEVEAKPKQEHLQTIRRTTGSNKANRSEYRDLPIGSIFIAEHYEELGERLEHKRPSDQDPLQSATPEEIESADGLDANQVTTCRSHAQIVIKDRKFLVLSSHYQHYVCIPLFTYRRRGLSTRLDQDAHISVLDHRGPAEKYLQQSKWKPLHTGHMTAEAYRLSGITAARMTFPLSRPKNLPVEFLGCLDVDSTLRFQDLYILLNDLASSPIEKSILQARHLDSTWTGMPQSPPPPPSSLSVSTTTAQSGLVLGSAQSPFSTSSGGNRKSPKSDPSRVLDWDKVGQDRARAARYRNPRAGGIPQSPEGEDDDDADTAARERSGDSSSGRALRRVRRLPALKRNVEERGVKRKNTKKRTWKWRWRRSLYVLRVPRRGRRLRGVLSERMSR